MAAPSPFPPRSGEGEGRERAAQAAQASRPGDQGRRVPSRRRSKHGAARSLTSLGGEGVRRWRVVAACLALAACSQKPAEQPVTYLDLDCAKPFDAQVAAITAQPQLNAAGVVGSEPYLYYSSADGRTSYLITRPGSPAHPAIMIQRARNGVHTDGCAYGSRTGFDELKAYLESLKSWTRTGAKK